MSTTSPDGELVRAAQAGSREAVAELFERHWRGAWRLAYAVAGSASAADDAAQAGFVRAVERIRKLRDPDMFRPWLHRIVMNGLLDERRRRRREVLVDAVPEVPAPEGEADAVEARDPLAMLEGLSPERRAVIVLRHCLDYSLDETAEILGLPRGTVQSRTARGLADLRARLEGPDDA